MKTHLELIEELAQRRRDEAKAAAASAEVLMQELIQKRLTLWDPVLQVIREAQAAYSHLVSLRHEQDIHSYLKFYAGPQGDHEGYALVGYDPEKAQKPYALRRVSGGGTEVAVATVESLVPTVMDIIAACLAKYEK